MQLVDTKRRSPIACSGPTIGDQIDELIMNSSPSDEDCEALEIVTRLQSACPEWRELRSGCVTTSNIKRVFTRVASLRLKDNEDPSALVRNMIGYTSTELSSVLISCMLPILNINRR